MAILRKGKTNTQPLGVYGAVTLLAGALVLATAMNGVFLILALVYTVAACLLFSRGSFRDIRQLMIAVPAIILVSTLLWQEEYTGPIAAPAVVSNYVSGFLVGVEMSLRALLIVLAVSTFVRTVRVSELSYLVESITKSKSFSFVFGLAFNISPYLQRISMETLGAIRMRGGFRPSNLVVSTKYLLSSTTLNALGKCQDISYAAEARAFGLARETGNLAERDRPTPSRTDLLVVVATAAVLVLSLTLRI